MTDGERLIKIETILNELKEDFDNHLSHHFRYTIDCVGRYYRFNSKIKQDGGMASSPTYGKRGMKQLLAIYEIF